MPRLAIAYDGSEGATSALTAAAALFEGAHADVLTVPDPVAVGAPATVTDTGTDRTIAFFRAQADERAAATAADGAAQARQLGLDAQPRVAPAGLADWSALLTAAKECEADVLVSGARGRGGIARAVLGSTSTSLLHHADRPLLVVPHGVGALDGDVLIAVDGSEHGDRAIETAARLFSGRPALIVHVWSSATLPAPGAEPDLHAVVVEWREQRAAEATETLQRAVATAREAGLEARGELLEAPGRDWRTIADAARKQSAAVIVAGSRGRGAARSALLGSVTSRLVHNAERPILITRAD